MVHAFVDRERRKAAAVATRVAERREALGEVASILVEEFGATEVILFGSMVEGDVHAASDVDLGVRGLSPHRYFDAVARVTQLLACDVDLVELETARPSLRAHIVETGQVLSTGPAL